MNALKTVWVAEYSHQQRCFHVETLAEALEKNSRGIVNGYALDFIPFAVVNDQATACDLCNRMRKTLRDVMQNDKDYIISS